MPDTGERRELTGRVNAKEAEFVQQSKKLASKTKQLSQKMDSRNRAKAAATKSNLKSKRQNKKGITP